MAIDSESAVQAIVALPFTLTMDGECLGTITSTQFLDFDVDVHMPTSRQYSDGRPYVGAPETTGLRSDIDWSEQLFSYLSPWGSVYSFSENQPLGAGDTAHITHLLFRIPINKNADHQSAQDIADSFISALPTWTRQLGAWIEIIRETWLSRSEYPGEQSVTITLGLDLKLWHFDGSHGHILSRGPTMGPPVSIGHTGITLSEWRLALELARKHRYPPTEYVFLRDARGSLRRGNTRRAVLDSATAAEISLAILLDQQTSSVGAAIQKAIRDANREMGRATTTLRNTFGIALRSDIQECLLTPRNRAIHAGIEPSQTTALTAVEIASELVELATPRASLLHGSD